MHPAEIATRYFQSTPVAQHRHGRFSQHHDKAGGGGPRKEPSSVPSFNGQTPSCSEERVISCCEEDGISRYQPHPQNPRLNHGGQYRPSIEQAHHSNDCCRTATGAGRLLNTALATISDRITTTGCDGVEPREAAAACQRSPQPKRAPKAPGVRSCHCHRSCGVSLLDAYAGLGKKVSLWPFRLAITTWRGPLSGHSPSPTTPESSHNAKRCLECFKLS